MHGEVVGPISPENQKVMNELHERYDMTSHTRADSDQASLLSNDFVDNYSIVGPPDLCIERIQKLSDLGLDKVIFVGATLGSDQNAAAESDALIAREVVANL
jgi:5,10-methylenetetrahydromethanopterin reductase